MIKFEVVSSEGCQWSGLVWSGRQVGMRVCVFTFVREGEERIVDVRETDNESKRAREGREGKRERGRAKERVGQSDQRSASLSQRAH